MLTRTRARTRTTVVVVVVTSLLSLVTSSPVLAEPLVMMEFRGTVVTGGLTLGVRLEPGDELRARVVFDHAAPDRDPSAHGLYDYVLMDVFTDRGSVFFKQPSSPGSVEGIRIYRGPTYEEFRARGFMYVHDDTEFFARFPVGTFADDTLPLTLPFDQATTSEFWFSRIPGGPLTRETLTDFSAAIVPEPHAALLAATALLPLARPRRPRRPPRRQVSG